MLKKENSGSTSKAKKSTSSFNATNGVKSQHGSAVSNARISQSETSVATRKKRDTFSHSIYEKAAEIYRHLKGEIVSSQLPTFDEDLERRRAYSLAFGAKRYESVLDDILLDSYFFSSYFKVSQKFISIVKKYSLQVLRTLKTGKAFKQGLKYSQFSPQILCLQASVLIIHLHCFQVSYTRAHLAKRQNLHQKGPSVKSPGYANYRVKRLSYSGLVHSLDNHATTEYDKFKGTELSNNSKILGISKKEKFIRFLACLTRVCVFHLVQCQVPTSGTQGITDTDKLVMFESDVSETSDVIALQIKSIRDHVATSLKKNTDVSVSVIIVAMIAVSWNLTAHLSSLIHPDRKVFAFGVSQDSHEMIEDKLERMAARNVALQEESFLDALPTDECLKKVRIIVVNVPCSKSGVVNPVDFVLQEGVTNSIKELARGNVDSSKVKGMAFQHLSFLRHAMKFPQVQAIIYITRSINNSENMDVVKKAMEMNQDERSKQSSYFELTPALPKLAQSLREAARISNGLVEKEISLTHKEPETRYLNLEPSAAMNGGFVALLKRQKPVETAQEVLERAAKKGLMKPKGKPARVNSPREKPKPARAQADMSRLRIKESPGGNLSDNEGERNSLKVVDKKRTPRSWHGSAEDVAKPNPKDVVSSIPKPSETGPKKLGKKMTQPKPFMF
ncbi:unnamed protein product [Porites evermanni]|uniref:SAM-dependent MTase RsmB/NOP-type domain-containing protein n=1 Tax=Porites evermanni TaxID=104178 RepID=A0ABN8RAE8_9CNID|nr:unnamed protein product [Porites evermanni]